MKFSRKFLFDVTSIVSCVIIDLTKHKPTGKIMGYRTVVILSNDDMPSWENDPELGEKIASGASTSYRTPDSRCGFQYGDIAECVHADQQSLMLIDGYNAQTLTTSNWRPGETEEETNLRVLKLLAEKMGYSLRKKNKNVVQGN